MSFIESLGKVHVIGAGGIGISAVAKLLRHEGKVVTGSDVGANETTAELEKAGVTVAVGHAETNLPDDATLVIYSSAVPATNPERAKAARLGIRELSYPDFLGELTKERWTICVSGTNGKSTTTALLGLMLERAGLDPTVIVGSKVASFPDGNLRLGRGKYLVVEACEHNAHFLKYHPQMIVLTNVEEDHLDFYRDLGHIRETFQEYVDRLPPDGTLVVNADDHVSFHELKPKTPFVTYAVDGAADYAVRHLAVGGGWQTFHVVRAKGSAETVVGDFQLGVPGKFNVANAMAAMTAALELGASVEAVQGVLREYPGIWRRFERVGEKDGALVISDYGHHPTAVAGTIEAARAFYAGRRIVLAFQPHQRNRTRRLFDEFVPSFDGADALVLAEIFDVAGREEVSDSHVSSKQLADAVQERDREHGVTRDVTYAADLDETYAALRDRVRHGDIVIIMGAGDIYTLAKKLV
jgi:UDP-N-acetylmuramate--alanine ligase